MTQKCLLTLLLLPLFLLTIGCSQKEAAKSPDLDYYDNGYGTYFVKGTRIEHPADTSSSIVVDWSREPAARAPEEFVPEENRGIVYKETVFADGREEGQPLDLHLDLMLPVDQKTDRSSEAGAGADTADGGKVSTWKAAGGGARAAAVPKKEKGSNERKPVVLLVPGGGFISCRIEDKYTEVRRYLAWHGYAVAIMEYRVIGQGRYCDAAEDVKDAVRWIRAQGGDYGLDPDRIILMGNSAGGYLAALAVCQGEDDGPLPVSCAVNFYGLSDLINNKADYEEAAIEAHHKPQSSDSQFVNGVLSGKGLTDAPEEAAKADPASYIDGTEPPFLHLHGDADLLVSPSQSVHLHEALLSAGTQSARYAVQGAGHGDRQFRTEKALDIVIDFMDKCCEDGD